MGNPHLEGLYELRKDVQRLFEGAKRANVESYAKYIVAVGEMKISGMTPPIILYSPAPLSMDDTAILIPWDAQIAAIDGETQLAARYEAAEHQAGVEERLHPGADLPRQAQGVGPPGLP